MCHAAGPPAAMPERRARAVNSAFVLTLAGFAPNVREPGHRRVGRPARPSRRAVGSNGGNAVENNQNQIQVELSEKEAEGIYSNLVFIAHSASEVILDFARALPGVPIVPAAVRAACPIWLPAAWPSTPQLCAWVPVLTSWRRTNWSLRP